MSKLIYADRILKKPKKVKKIKKKQSIFPTRTSETDSYVFWIKENGRTDKIFNPLTWGRVW